MRTQGLAMIVAGAARYVQADAQFAMESWNAYRWVGLYFLIIVVEMTYGKKITRDVKLSLSGSVAYSNALSLPTMLVLMVGSGELSVLLAPEAEYTTRALCWLLFSCVVGTGISYAGWWCRGCVSATTYTVIGVVNKAITLALNSLLSWGAATSFAGLGGLALAISGGLVYQQAPLRQQSP
jgi:GDP-mannose transporter